MPMMSSTFLNVSLVPLTKQYLHVSVLSVWSTSVIILTSDPVILVFVLLALVRHIFVKFRINMYSIMVKPLKECPLCLEGAALC